MQYRALLICRACLLALPDSFRENKHDGLSFAQIDLLVREYHALNGKEPFLHHQNKFNYGL